MAHLGDKLKAFREAKDWTQPQMAEYLDVKLRTYQSIETSGEVKKAGVLTGILKKIGANAQNNAELSDAGTVSAREHIEMLKEQNAFLRRNFETSLTTILEVQQQAGNQLGALTWYSALVANGRDEKKAAADLSEIHNNIASFEEVGSGDDNSQTNNNKRTSAKRKVRK